LREIAGARLHRRALTAELLALLDNSHGDSISLLLAAIVALDSPEAMPAISLLLSHPDHDVRKAATLALAALRGSKSPPKPPSETS
jgi:HEAT repeat protein